MSRERTYRLNEHFATIQGEGVHAGKTAYFLRLQGCPVGCWFCDSKSTWYNGGSAYTLDQIREIIARMDLTQQVVITGGEPLIHDLDDLISLLGETIPSIQITVETSGAYPFKGDLLPDWVTLSPKAAADWYVSPGVLLAASEIKYVVDDDFTMNPVYRHMNELGKMGWEHSFSAPVWVLMPEGSPPRPEMVAKTLDLLRAYPFMRFGPRLQYSYPEIGKGEGRNNEIISAESARLAARISVGGD